MSQLFWSAQNSRFQGQVSRAIDAAIALRAQVAEILPAQGTVSFRPKVSIGINSGEVVAGNIAPASLKRLDYTVIGDVVNTAQRLQSKAEEGQIVINEAMYQKVKESFNIRRIGEVQLKNKAAKMSIYKVLD